MSADRPIAAGSSSFDLVDRERLFGALAPLEGRGVLDLACGRGAYAVALAPLVGPRGRIWAVDLWEEGVAALAGEARRLGLGNVTALVADVSVRLPLPAASIDLCLMATVLHDLAADGTADAALAEVRRVLRPGGTLAVVEFRPIDGPPGPPRRIRLTPEALSERVRPFGFRPRRTLDAGPFTYLSLFDG